MRELKARMDQAVQDTIAATRIIEVFKNPQNAHTHVQQSSSLKNHAGFPLEWVNAILLFFRGQNVVLMLVSMVYIDSLLV